VNQPAEEAVQSASHINHYVEPEHKADSVGLCPNPAGLITEDIKVHLKHLKPMAYKSILSSECVTREALVELFKVAAYLQLNKIKADRILGDKIMVAAFVDPSTRTRLSFESAMLRLGGKKVSIASAASTGVAKGESLRDIGQMLNSYGDVVVVRHTEQRSLQELSKYLRIPLINGGNGSDENPTQAMADWYGLMKWRPSLIREDFPEKDRI